MDHEQLSLIFGGVFKTISEYSGSVSSPMYKRAKEMMDLYLEKGLDPSVLQEDLVDWINSDVLDNLKEPVDIQTFSNICSFGYLELAKWYVERFPGIDTEEAFECMCFGGHLELVKWFVQKYPETDVDDVLFVALCAQGHLDLIKWLVKSYPITADEYTFSTACRHGQLEVAKFLVETFPRIDVHDVSDDAFRGACRNGHLEVVEWFLEKYPETDVYANFGEPFKRACQNGYLDLVKFILKKYPNITDELSKEYAFALACKHGHLDLAKFFVKKYPEMVVHDFSELPFRSACQQGQLEVVKWFLETYPETEINFGDVCESSSGEVVKFLLERREPSSFDVWRSFVGSFVNLNFGVSYLLFSRRPMAVLSVSFYVLCMFALLFFILSSVKIEDKAHRFKEENGVHRLPFQSLEKSLADYQKSLEDALQKLHNLQRPPSLAQEIMAMINYLKERNITSF